MNKGTLLSLFALTLLTSACGFWRKKQMCCPPVQEPICCEQAPVVEANYQQQPYQQEYVEDNNYYNGGVMGPVEGAVEGAVDVAEGAVYTAGNVVEDTVGLLK